MNFFSYKHILRGFTVLAAVLLLSACDAVPTAVNDNLPNNNTEYSGPNCGIGTSDPDDACNFQRYFWAPMIANYSCENCHDSSAAASLQFLHEGDVNTAYTVAKRLVNPTTPEASRVIEIVRTGHKGSCDPASTCGAMEDNIITFINNWNNGGTSTDNGGGGSAIVLVAPEQNPPGQSRILPGPTAATYNQALIDFGPIHGLLTEYCASCHVESPPVQAQQPPFFAESDAGAAYAALRNSQKINLDNPANSSLVQRLAEGHNCWDLTTTSLESDKYVCATEMRTAIETFAGKIGLTEVDENWVFSKALRLKEGLAASGSARDDSSTIALYEFKAGKGNVISDTSGVTPTLNLRLEGDEDIDYKWVGGWGIEFLGGYARTPNVNNGQKLRDRIVASGQYSIELWLLSTSADQGMAGDPARIISYSAGGDRRNFTFGQAEHYYEYMHRSSTTDANGEPSLITGDENHHAALQHMVLTFDPNNGRRVYVNGEATDDADGIDPGNLLDWDDSFALLMGAEQGGSAQWRGKLRLVAIHDRAMSEAQIQQNFEAGVGEKFLLLFNVSEHLFATPPEPDKGTYVMFTVSQYDNYSYLFYKPTLVSLDPNFEPGSIIVKGLRLGLNGKEPGAGQAFVNIDTTVISNIYTNGGKLLSELGTIIALEKGTEADEFFLTFEQLGNSGPDVRVDLICNPITDCMAPPVNSPRVSDIGLRTFGEINASMAAITGVDMHAAGNESVKDTYLTVEQQLPSLEDISGFLPAHQMAIAQLAMQYCSALVEDSGLRNDFYGNFSFNDNVVDAYADSTQKQQMLDALYDNIIGLPDTNDSSNVLSGVPTRAELKAELFGPSTNNLFDKLDGVMQGICADPDPLINQNCDNSETRTRAIAKALCTATLGSAATLIQ